VSGEPVNATVMFYGPPEVSAEQLARLSSPLLGMFGDQDDGIPVATVRAFEEALKAAGKDVEFRIYEGAGHAFMNDTRPSHRPEAANDAWSRVEAFLAKHLKS
jgi:carboxymethylenebutenolidase